MEKDIPLGPRGGAVLNTEQGFTCPPVLQHLFLTRKLSPLLPLEPQQLGPARPRGPTVTGKCTRWPLHRMEGESGLQYMFGLTVHEMYLGYIHFFRIMWVCGDPYIFLWKSISVMNRCNEVNTVVSENRATEEGI